MPQVPLQDLYPSYTLYQQNVIIHAESKCNYKFYNDANQYNFQTEDKAGLKW